MASQPRSLVLCLVRCGETTWDGEGRVHGTTDLPLSDAGRASVADDVKHLVAGRITTIHHAPDEAASDTAQILAAGIKARTKKVADLSDPDLGLLDGLTEQVFSERYPKRYKTWKEDMLSLAAPEGEDILIARRRILSALVRLLRRTRGSEVAVVLHDLGLGFLRCALSDQPVSRLWPMIRNRPRIERYALDTVQIQWLEELANTDGAE